jgi:hypothetical protein
MKRRVAGKLVFKFQNGQVFWRTLFPEFLVFLNF